MPQPRIELLQALQTLTARQREVVLLHDIEGWSHAEISDSLEISERRLDQFKPSRRPPLLPVPAPPRGPEERRSE